MHVQVEMEVANGKVCCVQVLVRESLCSSFARDAQLPIISDK